MQTSDTTEYTEPEEGEVRTPASRRVAILFGTSGLLLITVLARWHSYLLFHTLVELFAVFVALGVFVIAWNTRRYQRTGYLPFLGIAYLFVGAVDLLHALAYHGMGLFVGYDADLPTQLWIVARLIESAALLLAPLFLRRRLRNGAVMATAAVVTAIAVGAVFARIFPVCYDEGTGLTLFKVLTEYVICAVLLVAGIVTYRRRAMLDGRLTRLVLGSIVITIVSELSFTLYVDVYGGMNMLGHLLKCVSYLLIYLGVVDGALRRPYEVLFHDLALSRKFYRALFAHMTSGVAVYSAVEDGGDFVVRDINAAGERISQVSRSEVVGKRLLGIFPSARKIGLLDTFQRVWRSGQSESMPISFYADDRLKQWVENRVYRLPSGEVAAVYNDVTSRKQMEEALRESELRYRLLMQHATDVIWVLDAESQTCLYISPSVERMLGFTDKEMIGRNVAEVVTPASLEHIKATTPIRIEKMTQGDVSTFTDEIQMIHKAGHTVWTEMNMRFVLNPETGRVEGTGVMRDITERKRAEVERLELGKRLQDEQKLAAVGTLACGMGHEINNPIMGIINYAQLIKDRLQHKDGNAGEFADEIVIEAERIAGIVRSLTAFAARDAAARASVPVSDLVESALAPLRDALSHDRIALHVDLPDNLPGVVCDRAQIAQVLTSLLNNARDALNEKYPARDEDKRIILNAEVGTRNAEEKWERGVLNEERGSPRAQTGVSIRSSGSSVPRSEFPVPRSVSRILRLTVEDHGAGIPPEVREHIFEPFFTTKDKSIGAGNIGKGLGLFVSHAYVQEHGGLLTVESEVGQWTRFHVDLPIDSGNAEAARDDDDRQPEALSFFC